MRSMTGFGRAAAARGARTLAVQVNAVNRKTLDLAVRLPEAWASLEPKIVEEVRRHATRGRIQVAVEWEGSSRPPAVEWDDEQVAATLDRLAGLARWHGVAFTPTLRAALVGRDGAARRDAPPDAAGMEEFVLGLLAAALREFSAMRAREGGALLADFVARLAGLRRLAQDIAARAPLVPGLYREQLLQRLRTAGLELDLADERVLKEIALFADRADITEELTRLRSHFEQFAALLEADGEIGRRAEFLLQEVGREVNTIGSKANDLAIARAVLEMKNELERIREQMANVE